MNNFGFVLAELGLASMLEAILHRVLAPLSRILLPQYVGGGGQRGHRTSHQAHRVPPAAAASSSSTFTSSPLPTNPTVAEHGTSLDSQHTFTIRYSAGEDTSLDKHMDQSAVTLNVCLSGAYSGADVYFKGQRDHPNQHTENALVQHRPGFGLLHVSLCVCVRVPRSFCTRVVSDHTCVCG
jgi:hypothetical protein